MEPIFESVAASLIHGGMGTAALGALAATMIFAAAERRSRERLRVSEERYRLALEATSEVVWDWDVARDSIVHPNWARTYGFPEERTPRNAKQLGEFIHPDDLPAFGGQLHDVVEGRRDTLEVEHRALTAAGDWKWMLARARAVGRDATGRPMRLVGTCTDVTERHRLQSRLNLVDRMASMGTLAASVGHEINNPLAFMMCNLEFVVEAMERAERAPSEGTTGALPQGAELSIWRRALAETLDGAHRVRSIVRDLRVFSRTDEEPLRPVDAVGSVRLALSLAGAELRHRARVTTRFDAVPPVMAEETRLAQVFVNLLVNAAQALPIGSADRNEISVTAECAPDGRVAVAVRDTGCGIPASELGRIFDPFFTTKPKGVGTGLGLAICHGIVAAAGGEITVESEVGKGTTFRVLLPAAPRDAALGSPISPPAPPADVEAAGARVLVVDDEPLVGAAMARLLADEHEVTVVTSAAEALARIRDGARFEIILTDLVMPQMTGMDLLAELQRRAPSVGDRVLFVTGAPGAGGSPEIPAFTEFTARNAGRVLEKPVTARALRSAVATLLRRTGRCAAATPAFPVAAPPGLAAPARRDAV